MFSKFNWGIQGVKLFSNRNLYWEQLLVLYKLGDSSLWIKSLLSQAPDYAGISLGKNREKMISTQAYICILSRSW